MLAEAALPALRALRRAGLSEAAVLLVASAVNDTAQTMEMLTEAGIVSVVDAAAIALAAQKWLQLQKGGLTLKPPLNDTLVFDQHHIVSAILRAWPNV